AVAAGRQAERTRAARRKAERTKAARRKVEPIQAAAAPGEEPELHRRVARVTKARRSPLVTTSGATRRGASCRVTEARPSSTRRLATSMPRGNLVTSRRGVA